MKMLPTLSSASPMQPNAPEGALFRSLVFLYLLYLSALFFLVVKFAFSNRDKNSCELS